MDVQSVVRGHHVYKCMWAPVIGEELTGLPEARRRLPQSGGHAVAVMKNDELVGYVPRELFKILYHFLKHSGEVSCVITGRRKYGVGLEVPCVYKEAILIKRLKRLLAAKN